MINAESATLKRRKSEREKLVAAAPTKARKVSQTDWRKDAGAEAMEEDSDSETETFVAQRAPGITKVCRCGRGGLLTLPCPVCRRGASVSGEHAAQFTPLLTAGRRETKDGNRASGIAPEESRECTGPEGCTREGAEQKTRTILVSGSGGTVRSGLIHPHHPLSHPGLGLFKEKEEGEGDTPRGDGESLWHIQSSPIQRPQRRRASPPRQAWCQCRTRFAHRDGDGSR